MSEEATAEFIRELEALLEKYQFRMNNYEGYSALCITADQISQDIRQPPRGPSPLS